MIKLFPGTDTSDDESTEGSVIEPGNAVAAEQRPAHEQRPWIYSNMIASPDGGTAVDGLSGQLGGPGDKAMFGALRSVADIILVGASTVREERYRVAVMKDEVVEQRRRRGQADHPRLAIVSRSLSIDLELPLFDDPSNRPYILTSESAPADKRQSIEPLAEILIAGQDGVDLPTAALLLAERGARTVLSEGGPSVNGQLIAEGLIDEWNLSISPRLLGADSRRAAIGPVASGPPVGMRLARVWTDDDFLFCRWVRAAADADERA